MAIREVTVEVNTKYIVKVKAGNADEACDKAESLVLDGMVIPVNIESIVLDVQPIKGT